MRLDELQAWIKSAKYVETSWSQTDSCDNRETEIIYEKDGLFYRIGFMNGHPYLHTTAIGTTIKGDYEEPTPVRKASRMEYVTEWVE